MNNPRPIWHEENERYLRGRLDLVREGLRSLARSRGIVPDEEPLAASRHMADAMEESLSSPPALDILCSIFHLTEFERGLLLLCAGVELDPEFPALCAAARNDQQRPFATLNLAMELFGDGETGLLPVAPVRYWKMVEMVPGDLLHASAVRIDERILHYLNGMTYLDERLQGLVAPVEDTTLLAPSQWAHVERVGGIWRQREKNPPVIHLCGGDEETRQAIASASAREGGMRLYAIRVADVPALPADREMFIRLWAREAMLAGNALLIECDDGDHLQIVRALVPIVDGLRGAVIVASRDPFPLRGRSIARIDVRHPSSAEQRDLWHDLLGPTAGKVRGTIDDVVSNFNLSPAAVSAVALQVRDPLARGGASAGDLLWERCRSQARSRLDELAARIEPFAGWDDLVLPELQLRIIREIAAHVRQRARVYEEWGMASKGNRGLGISALFAGPSGTGKTLAAEVIAAELRLDLYHIDLSQIVSKYIGETEKNLRRIFDAAEEAGAVLLFDEADALFGKRSEVKDSHDRHANIEVSYLLQRMESYRGLAILTTNMKQALDTAFLRRIRFVVDFPFPDPVHRAEIWRRIYPEGVPCEGLDHMKLAKLNVAGGNIRNIALNAAFLAADEGEPVRMRHMLRAVRSEYLKLEKQLTDAEIKEWV